MTADKAEVSPARRAGPQRRRRRTPDQIRGRLLAAAREEFKDRGYAGATTAAIARRADVAEIQMFRYFPSKADLFRESVFAPLADHFRAFNARHGPEAVDEESIRQRAGLYLTELQAFLEEHGRMLISLHVAQTLSAQDTGVQDLQAYFNESAALMTERADGAGGIDPGKIVRVAFGALLGCITYRDWLFPDAGDEQDGIDDAIRAFILAGIGPFSDLGPAGGGEP